MSKDTARNRHPLLRAADIEQMEERRYPHPLNLAAVRHGRSLGDATGLEHIGLHLVRIEPGDETTEVHFHYYEEEFIYILSGRGLAEIGDGRLEIGPGDFMGFCRRSLPHSMSNPFDEDLVYLMGGLRLEVDVCEYPRLGKRLFSWHGRSQLVDIDDEEFPPPPR